MQIDAILQSLVQLGASWCNLEDLYILQFMLVVSWIENIIISFMFLADNAIMTSVFKSSWSEMAMEGQIAKKRSVSMEIVFILFIKCHVEDLQFRIFKF